MIDFKVRFWQKGLGKYFYFDSFSEIYIEGNTDGDVDLENPEFFIGIRDKNLVEIYDWDILLDDDEVKYRVEIGGYFSSGDVGFGVHYILCRDSNNQEYPKTPDPFGVERHMEVIGNIHQNPELLES